MPYYLSLVHNILVFGSGTGYPVPRIRFRFNRSSTNLPVVPGYPSHASAVPALRTRGCPLPPFYESYPSYGFNIPNGARVACPCRGACVHGRGHPQPGDTALGEPASWCSGVAVHHTCTGGSLPLESPGRCAQGQWNGVDQGACQADSDGDGLSNGDELGDPCCTCLYTRPHPT